MIALLVSSGLCLQYALFSLLRSALHDDTPVYTVLLYVELLKGAVSLFMARRLLDRVCARPLPILAPVACFMLMNIVSYNVISHVPATVYVMVMQLKLPATYACSYVALSKQLTIHQTIAVAFICISCANISQKSPIDNSRIEPLYILGMLLETVCSALSSVYMQKVFANDLANLWIRNVELSACSLPAYAALIAYHDHPWTCTPVGYLFACLGAAGGVLVALTLIHGDAVEKTISSSVSVLLVALCEHAMHRKAPSVSSASFYSICLLSVLLYASHRTERRSADRDSDLRQDAPLLEESASA